MKKRMKKQDARKVASDNKFPALEIMYMWDTRFFHTSITKHEKYFRRNKSVSLVYRWFAIRHQRHDRQPIHTMAHDFSNVFARFNHDSHYDNFFIGIKKDFSFRLIWKIRSCMRGARACSKSRDDRPLPPMCVPAQDPIEQALTPRDDVEAKKKEKE